jgi:hypothetical protein
VNSEFNWWLLIVGLAIGAGLVWLVLADSSRRETEVTEEELPAEATWIAATLADAGEEISPETAERVLRLHRSYLGAPPPDAIEDWPAESETAQDGGAPAGDGAPERPGDAPRWDEHGESAAPDSSDATAATARRREREAAD